jgi:hypothetical protein
MPTFYIASSADFNNRKIETQSLSAAKRAASRFYGVAGCGYLTVSVFINEGTDCVRWLEMVRKYGRGKWQQSHSF